MQWHPIRGLGCLDAAVTEPSHLFDADFIHDHEQYMGGGLRGLAFAGLRVIVSQAMTKPDTAKVN